MALPRLRLSRLHDELDLTSELIPVSGLGILAVALLVELEVGVEVY